MISFHSWDTLLPLWRTRRVSTIFSRFFFNVRVSIHR